MQTFQPDQASHEIKTAVLHAPQEDKMPLTTRTHEHETRTHEDTTTRTRANTKTREHANTKTLEQRQVNIEKNQNA